MCIFADAFKRFFSLRSILKKKLHLNLHQFLLSMKAAV